MPLSEYLQKKLRKPHDTDIRFAVKIWIAVAWIAGFLSFLWAVDNLFFFRK